MVEMVAVEVVVMVAVVQMVVRVEMVVETFIMFKKMALLVVRRWRCWW